MLLNKYKKMNGDNLKKVFKSIGLIGISVSALGQNLVIRNYHTQQEETTQLKIIEVAERKNEIEKASSAYYFKTANQQKTIPLVFHIYGESTRTAVMNQMEALNEHFANENDRLSISFCIGNKLGKTGIEYYNNLTDTINTSFWNNEEYLNIIVKQLPDTVAGYGLMPWSNIDDHHILINEAFFGTSEAKFDNYNKGATLTHLIANTFGLYDLWYQKGKDDGVNDTPIHNAPNYGCPGEGHISTITGEDELTTNFMDNTNDTCLSTFTIGQVRRMHSILNIAKQRLITNKNVNCEYNPEEDEESLISEEIIEMAIMPNPAEYSTTVKLNIEIEGEEKATLKIYSSDGKLMQTSSFTGKSKEVDVAGLDNGNYNIELLYKDKVYSEQLVIIRK